MIVCATTKHIRVTYSAPVANCVRRLMVLPPPQRGSQTIIYSDWHCSPEPDSVREQNDNFGNRILELCHDRIQHEFRFELTMTTSREACGADFAENLPESGVGAFLVSSALCDVNATVRRTAQEILQATEPSLCAADKDSPVLRPATRARPYPTVDPALLEGICERVFQTLHYTPGTTHTRTAASHAMQQGAGICQDYAHLMIALCRALNIPARYISGYNPAEGLMHAWAEALYNGRWHAWDPTHNRATQPNCVYVACGRDFRDVAPITGTYRGRAKAKLTTVSQTQVIQRDD
jgi:transglutaminase-like putative cysteine protease